MFYLLLVVEMILGVLLIGSILLQRSKEQGLGLAFGSGVGESLFGSEAVSVLMKATIVLAALFFLNTIVLARITAKGAMGGGITVQVPRASPQQPTAPSQVPAGELELPAVPVTPGGSSSQETPSASETPAASVPAAPAPDSSAGPSAGGQ